MASKVLGWVLSSSLWLERPRCTREVLGGEVRECTHFGRQVSPAGIDHVDVTGLNIERWQQRNEATFAHVRTDDEVGLERDPDPLDRKRDQEATTVGMNRSTDPYRSLASLAVAKRPDVAHRRVCV